LGSGLKVWKRPRRTTLTWLRLARTEERQAANTRLISLVQADLRDVKHGRGFIQNRNAGGVNGEYE
jgi:hypothetical protein